MTVPEGFLFLHGSGRQGGRGVRAKCCKQSSEVRKVKRSLVGGDSQWRLAVDGSPRQLTHFGLHSTFIVCLMGVTKIQVGQLWKKDGSGDIYLVTRLYSEALNTMVILRKSGAEGEAQIRVRVERAGSGQKIPGFSPAQEDDSF
jgi:hypothetical protein